MTGVTNSEVCVDNNSVSLTPVHGSDDGAQGARPGDASVWCRGYLSGSTFGSDVCRIENPALCRCEFRQLEPVDCRPEAPIDPFRLLRSRDPTRYTCCRLGEPS